MNDKLNELYLEIKKECLKIINKNKIDINELSFRMGISTNTLYNVLNEKNKDFSIYLKLYEVLLGWWLYEIRRIIKK